MKRCVKRLLHARGWRVLAQRVLLLMLFLLTLLVVVARLDAEASLRILEANTLVLQVGQPFPLPLPPYLPLPRLSFTFIPRLPLPPLQPYLFPSRLSFTFIVFVVKLDPEASLRILEANTLVLQVGHLLVFLLLLVSLSLLSHVFLFLIFFLLVFLSPSSSS